MRTLTFDVPPQEVVSLKTKDREEIGLRKDLIRHIVSKNLSFVNFLSFSIFLRSNPFPNLSRFSAQFTDVLKTF